MMKKVLWLIFAWFGLVWGTHVYASQSIGLSPQAKVPACVQYQRKDHSWGKAYSVKANIVSGSALSKWAQGQHHFSGYFSDYYLVVFWKKGGYVALDLGKNSYPPVQDLKTYDQQGRVWKVRQGYCQ